MLDSIPPPFNVYFLGAHNINEENPKSLADIQLKRSADGSKLIGSDSIIYSNGDIHEIYVLDSSEIGLKQKLLTINDSPNSIIAFVINEKTLNPNGYVNENGEKLPVPTRIELISETTPYHFEIKQSDAKTSLNADKMNALAIWVTLAFTPLALIPIIRHYH